jgi:hypothetical protein
MNAGLRQGRPSSAVVWRREIQTTATVIANVWLNARSSSMEYRPDTPISGAGYTGRGWAGFGSELIAGQARS